MRPSCSAGFSICFVLLFLCCVCLTNADASTTCVDSEAGYGFRRPWKRGLGRGKRVVKEIVENIDSAHGRDQTAVTPSSQAETLERTTGSASTRSGSRSKRRKKASRTRIRGEGEEQRNSEANQPDVGSEERPGLHEPLLQLMEIAEQAMSGSGGQPKELPLVHQRISAPNEVVPEVETGTEARRWPIGHNVPADTQTHPATGRLSSPAVDPAAQPRDTASPLSVAGGNQNLARHGTSSSSMSKEEEVQSLQIKPLLLKVRGPRTQRASARDPRSTSVGAGLTMSSEKEDISNLAPGQVIQGDTSTSASGDHPGSTDLTLRIAVSDDGNMGGKRSRSTPIELAGEEALSQTSRAATSPKPHATSPGVQGVQVRPLSPSSTEPTLGGLGRSALENTQMPAPDDSSSYAKKTRTSPGPVQHSPNRQTGDVRDSGPISRPESIADREGLESEQGRKRKRPMEALPVETAGHSGELSANSPNLSSGIKSSQMPVKLTVQSVDSFVERIRTVYYAVGAHEQLRSNAAEFEKFQENLNVLGQWIKYELRSAAGQSDPNKPPKIVEQDRVWLAIKYFEEKFKVRYGFHDDLPDAPAQLSASAEQPGTSKEKAQGDSPHSERMPPPGVDVGASLESTRPSSSSQPAPGEVGGSGKEFNTQGKQQMDPRPGQDTTVAPHDLSAYAEQYTPSKGSQFGEPSPAKSASPQPREKNISAESSETSTGKPRGGALPARSNFNAEGDPNAPPSQIDRPSPSESIETFDPRLWDIWTSQWLNTLTPVEKGIAIFQPEAIHLIRDFYVQHLFDGYQKGRGPSSGGKTLTKEAREKLEQAFIQAAEETRRNLPKYMGRKSSEFEKPQDHANPIIYISDSPTESELSQSIQPPSPHQAPSEEEIFRQLAERILPKEPSQALGGQKASYPAKPVERHQQAQPPEEAQGPLMKKFVKVARFIYESGGKGKTTMEKFMPILIKRIKEIESKNAVPVFRESHSAVSMEKDPVNQAAQSAHGTRLPVPHGMQESESQSLRSSVALDPIEFVPQAPTSRVAVTKSPKGTVAQGIIPFAQRGPRAPVTPVPEAATDLLTQVSRAPLNFAPVPQQPTDLSSQIPRISVPQGPRLPVKPLSIGPADQFYRTHLLQTPRGPLAATPRGPVPQGTPRSVLQGLQGPNTSGLNTPRNAPMTSDAELNQQINLAAFFMQLKNPVGSPHSVPRAPMEAQQYRNQNPEWLQHPSILTPRNTQGSIYSPSGTSGPSYLNPPQRPSTPPSNVPQGGQQVRTGPERQQPNTMRPHLPWSQATNMPYGSQHQRVGSIVQPVGLHRSSQGTNPATDPLGSLLQRSDSKTSPVSLQRSSQITSQANIIPHESQPTPVGQVGQISGQESFQLFTQEALRALYAAQKPSSGHISQPLNLRSGSTTPPVSLQRSSQITSQADIIPHESQPTPVGQIGQMSSQESFQLFTQEALRALYAAQKPSSGHIAQPLNREQLEKFLKEAEQQKKNN